MTPTDPMKAANPINKRYCGAKTRAGGSCRRAPLRGTTRCRLHGGSSPQAQRKAAETLAEWRAMRAGHLDSVVDQQFKRWLGDPRRVPAAIVPRLLELADRFRGGGERHEVDVSVADEGRERLRKLLPYVDEDKK